MPLNAGDRHATEGMAKAVYETLDGILRPPLEDAGIEPETIEQSRAAWRTVGYAVAKGVTDHLVRDPETEPEYGEAYSSADQDAAFWDWLSDFAGRFASWARSPTGDVASLKSSLDAFFDDNPVPEELKGVIR